MKFESVRCTAVGISLLSCIRAEINVNSYLLPVIGCYLWFTTCPCRHGTVFSVVYPCCRTPKIWVWPLDFRCYHVYKLRFVQLNFQSRHLVFQTSAYLLAAYYHCYNTSVVSARDYSGAAVRIPFLASVQQEIYIPCVTVFTVFIYNFWLTAAILANWWVVNLFWLYQLVALPYLGKVTEAFPLTRSGYEVAAERMACG